MAYHILSSSLGGLTFELQKGLDFLVCRIKELFEQEDRDIILVIKRLGVLAARLEYYLTSKSPEDASSVLHTNFSFLDTVLISKSPEDLAKRYITQDAKLFRATSVYDFLTSTTGYVIYRLRAEREALKREIRECLSVDRNLSKFIGKVVEVSWPILHA